MSYETLWQHAPCGHIVLSSNDVIIDANTTLLAWIGHTREQLVGTTLRDLLDPGSQFFYETRQQPVLRLGGEVREVSLTLRRGDGTVFPVLLNATVHTTGEVLVSVFDATERHGYERELLLARRAAELSESRVRVLQDAARVFGAAASASALTQSLVDLVRDSFAATTASVLLASENGELEIVAGTHHIGVVTPHTMPSWIAYDEHRVVTITDLESVRDSNPDLHAFMKTQHFESLIAVPLLDVGSPIGTVTCFFGRRREFDDFTIDLQQALARQAAQSLERIRLQEALESMALTDQLTGLANRALLNELLTRAVHAARADARPIAVIFLDLDGFKAVNDALGHSVGDSVLRQVGNRLRGGVRENDFIGRFGGDEFVVVCADADADTARAVAERIRLSVSEPLDGIPAWFPVSASLGVVVFHADIERYVSNDELLNRADDAMYQAKGAGKNRVALVEL